MSKSRRLAILVWIACFVLGGCAGGSDVGEAGRPAPRITPEDEFEARCLALCLSESLVPLPELVNTILLQLSEIRYAYGFSALTRTRAKSHWTGEIDVTFDPGTSHEFASGGYFFWNELNAELGPVRIVPLEFGMARLHFSRAVNPCLAAERYAQLPGILMAEPVFDTTDGPDIYVGLNVLHGYTYLFRDARDDCETRCRFEEYYYFRFFDTGPVLIGRWNPADSEPPAWWNDALDEWIACSCYPERIDTRRERRRTPRMR